MKFFKKGAAVLLAISLCVLSACGGNTPAPDNETAMGRYIEERWELPIDAVNISVLARRPDGKIFAVMNDMGSNGDGENVTIKGFVTSNGKDWEEDTPPWLVALIEKGGYVSNLAYGKNGECFLTYNIMEGDNYFIRVARVTQGGLLEDLENIAEEWEKSSRSMEVKTYSMDQSASGESSSEESAVDDKTSTSAPSDMIAETGEESEDSETEESSQAPSFYPTGIVVGDDGDLYISQYIGIHRFTQDGKYKLSVTNSYYPKFTYYDNSLAVLDYGSVQGNTDTFKLYDIETGEVRQDLGFQALQSTQQGAQIATGQDGALYLANPNGIYRLVPQGTTWERMVDGDLCSLSVPSMSINGFIPHGDNDFLTLTTEQDKPALINYIYSATTPTRPNTELTVATLKKNSTLLQAAGEFRRQHPEVLVTIQTLLEEDGSATTADAIRALNTQLLAGKGPDLLLLDGLPTDSYIAKGVLADMSDWLSPIIQQGLISNITGALTKDGKLYAVPTRFTMPTIWGKPEAVNAASSLESLAGYAQANTDNKLLYDMNKQSLFRYFTAASAPAWLDNKGKLDEAAFAEYLDLIKRLADCVPDAEAEEFKMHMSPGFTMTGIDTGGALDLPFGKASLFSAELVGFESLMIPNGAISGLHGLVITADTTSIEDNLLPSHFTLLPGQAEGVFIPRCIMGINAAGKQQELAQEFIKTVLGETVQYSDLQDGFPVNRAAIEANIIRRNDLQWGIAWGDEDTGEQRTIEMGWPSPGAFRAVCALFDKLDTPFMPDDTLMEMILDETESFFSGSLSARETASAVAARLELYLAEQG